MDQSEIPEMLVGTIARLWRYPVKSLAAEALNQTTIEADGLSGDRRRALIGDDPGHARSGKPFRGKEHPLLHTLTSAPAAAQIGASAGVALRVVCGERYFDAQPVSLLFDIWLRDVETLVGRPLDPLRYRPNIFVLAHERFTTREHELVGATLDAGNATLRVVATIGRCVTTTYDVATGHSDPTVLREVAQRRRNTVGVYCVVDRPGTLTIGDPLRQRSDPPVPVAQTS